MGEHTRFDGWALDPAVRHLNHGSYGAVRRRTLERQDALRRRIEALASEQMPAGYVFLPDPNEVAAVVLARSTWAVLALTCDIELFTQAHYRESLEGDENLSPLFKDVFLYHWKEESQHAILDELEWQREDAKLTAPARDAAVDDLIALVGAVDGILQAQAAADAAYFKAIAGRAFTADEAARIDDGVLAAYRWQYIVSGVSQPRFADVLGRLIDGAQRARIEQALAPIVHHVANH